MVDHFSRYADHVKAGFGFFGASPADVIPRGASKRVNLIRIDSAFRSAPFARRAEFHLHEDQRPAFPSHKIQFAPTLRRTPVPRSYRIPERSQMTVRQVFAAPSLISVMPEAKAVAQPVKRAQQVQTRTPSPCPARYSRDRTPRIAGNAGTDLPETRSRAISRKTVASPGRKSHEISRANS